MFHQSIKYFISAIVIVIALFLNSNQNALAEANEHPLHKQMSFQKESIHTLKTTTEINREQTKVLPKTGQNRKHTPILALAILLILGITLIFIKQTSSKK